MDFLPPTGLERFWHAPQKPSDKTKAKIETSNVIGCALPLSDKPTDSFIGIYQREEDLEPLAGLASF